MRACRQPNPIDPSRLIHELAGPISWGEAVLYAALVGIYAAGGQEQMPLRLQWGEISGYGAGILSLEHALSRDPGTAVLRRRHLSALAGIAAHENWHHDLPQDPGQLFAEISACERALSLQARYSILSQLDVHCLIREADVPSANLEGYWLATAGQRVEQDRQRAVEEGYTLKPRTRADMATARRSSTEEFLCQVAACLARLRLRHDAKFIRCLWASLQETGLVPSPTPPILERIYRFAQSDDVENLARETARQYLAQDESSAWSRARSVKLAHGWPRDLRRGIDLISRR